MAASGQRWWHVPAGTETWLAAYRLGNLLLRAGADVRWVLDDGDDRAAGDLLVAMDARAAGRVQSMGAAVGAVLRPGSVSRDGRFLRLGTARVAVYGGGGAPYNHARILAEAGFDVAFVTAQAIQRGALSAFDVLVVPGGGRTANRGQLQLLGDTGANQVRRFVEAGGLYLGSCAGAYNVSVIPVRARPPYGQRLMQLINVGMWHSRDTKWHWREFPGVGVIESRNLRPEHPVMLGLPQTFPITHYNGPFFAPVHGALDGASEAVPLMRVTGYTGEFTPGEYALCLSRYRGVAEGTVIRRAIDAGGLNGAAGQFGRGRVVVFGSHPEFGCSLEMDELSPSARMLANAVFWQSAYRSQRRDMPGERADNVDAAGGERSDAFLGIVFPRYGAISAARTALADRPLRPRPSWLDEDQAMSTFGLAGEVIWRRLLARFPNVEARVIAALERLRALLGANGTAIRRPLRELRRAVDYAAPEVWRQDFGYQGLLKTLETCHELLLAAHANFDVTLRPSPDPYEHDNVSPYHLVAACYYSAFGILQNAWQLLRLHECRLQDAFWVHGDPGSAGSVGIEVAGLS